LVKSRFKGVLWSKQIVGFPAVFWHQSLDGSKLLTRRLTYGYRFDSLEDLARRLDIDRQEMKSYGLSADIRLTCNDFQPPPAGLAGHCGELLARRPSIVVTGDAQHRYFDHLHTEVKAKGIRLPVTARDMEHYHQGTPLTRVEFKICNRLAENAVLNAEKFGAIASFLGARYADKALDKAWQQLLFNQHHDGITGPLCDRAYLDLMAGYRDALELASDALDRSMRYIGRFVDTAVLAPNERALPLLVFNSLNWERTDVVEAEANVPKAWKGFKLVNDAGKAVPLERVIGSANRIRFIAEQVPSVGYRTYFLVEAGGTPPEPERVAGTRIENEFLRIAVAPEKGGGITSLYDRKARRELMPEGVAPGNELVALEENPHRTEPPWEIHTTGPKVFSRDFPAKVEVQAGPVSQRLVIRGPFKDCSKRQEIILYPGLRRVDCVTSLEQYKGIDDLLVVTMPNNLQGVQPVFEERFGAVVRRQSKGYLDFKTQAPNNHSGHGLASAYQWMDRSYSALLKFPAEGKGQAEATVALGMVALMTQNDPGVIEVAERLQSCLIRKGIFCTPLMDDGEMKRRRGLPKEDWTIRDNPNDDLSYGTSFRIVLDVGGRNRYLSYLLKRLNVNDGFALENRRKRDGCAFLFCRDDGVPQGWPPVPVLAISATDRAALRLGVEKIARELEKTGVASLPREANVTGEWPWVDDYGLAILNQGNILNSVENDGTILLCLMHTSPWGVTPWGKDRLPFFFVPEWKAHRFAYALYPHSGDWRTAQVYRRGFEYNNPLLALAGEIHAAPLPPRHSFVQVEAEELVLTALKPRGNPTAGLEGEEPEAAREFVLRMYEATGAPVEARITLPAPITECMRTNLLEEDEGAAPFDGQTCTIPLGPFAIETVACSLVPPAVRGDFEPLGAEQERVQPVHFRYWEHNAGASHMGNSPVEISIHGLVRTGIHIRQGGVTVNTIQLAIANDYVDRRILGVAHIVVPEGWEAVPNRVEYNLEPGEHQLTPILIAFHSRRRKGVIKARLEHEGQVYQDVIEVGEPGRLDLTVRREGAAVEAEVTNPTEDEAEGTLTFITPLETWGRQLAGAFSLFECRDYVRPVSLRPGESARFRLAFTGKAPNAKDWWVVARLAHNGQVNYKFAPGLTIAESE
jgi:hypothetical protein